MKILMITTNHNDKVLAVLAFKELNAAISIDFVTTVKELIEYIDLRDTSIYDFPDLIVVGLDLDEWDVMRKVIANSKWANVKMVTFSTHSQRDVTYQQSAKTNTKGCGTSNLNELNWILKEICGVLMTKEGWQYSVGPSSRTTALN